VARRARGEEDDEDEEEDEEEDDEDEDEDDGTESGCERLVEDGGKEAVYVDVKEEAAAAENVVEEEGAGAESARMAGGVPYA
jgi:hypothetical protein